MGIFDKRTARVLATILLFLAAGAFLWGARRTIIAFLFAVFFAFLLDPLVNLVSRTRLGHGSRGRSILIVYVALIAIVGGALTLAGPKLVKEGRNLATQLPTLIDNVTSGQIAHQIGTRRGWSWNTQVRAEQFLSSHRDKIIAWAGVAEARAAELAGNVVWLVLIPILAIFFLKDGRLFADTMTQSVERKYQRQFLRGVFDDIHEMLAAYIRSQLLLAAISLVAYSVVLTVLRVPYSFVLGAIGGVMEFVPVVGPLMAAIMILGVSFLSNYPHLLIVLLFLAAWRGIQDYVNSPRIMGSRVELHPLAVLFGVLAGAEVAGVIGVYLSVPIMATLRIIWRRWQHYEETQQVLGPGKVDPANIRAA